MAVTIKIGRKWCDYCGSTHLFHTVDFSYTHPNEWHLNELLAHNHWMIMITLMLLLLFSNYDSEGDFVLVNTELSVISIVMSVLHYEILTLPRQVINLTKALNNGYRSLMRVYMVYVHCIFLAVASSTGMITSPRIIR